MSDTFFHQLSFTGEKDVHWVLVNHLGKACLGKVCMVRILDHPDMTTAVYHGLKATNEPRSFRPGPTQTGLYSHRKRLEA